MKELLAAFRLNASLSILKLAQIKWTYAARIHADTDTHTSMDMDMDTDMDLDMELDMHREQ